VSGLALADRSAAFMQNALLSFRTGHDLAGIETRPLAIDVDLADVTGEAVLAAAA
jgi:hypothetical protein